MYRSLTLCSLFLSGIATSTANAADAYQVKDTPGQHADVITPAGQPILRYMYARDTSDAAKTFDTAKIYAHVMAEDGKTTLTKGAGGKFPHHRGIFIGWNKLKHGGKSHDLWHVRNTLQKHREFEAFEATDKGARITSMIDWLGTDGKPVLEHNLKMCREASIHEIYINLHHLPDLIRNYFGDGSKYGVNIIKKVKSSSLPTNIKNEHQSFANPLRSP